MIMRSDKKQDLEEYEKEYLKNLTLPSDVDSSKKGSTRKNKNNDFKISDEIDSKNDLPEISQVKNNIDSDEKVLYVVKQMRNIPGGAIISSPNSLIATDKKIIKINPTMLGTRVNIEEIPYNEIIGVKLEKGLLSSTIVIKVHGMSDLGRLASELLAWRREEYGAIDAIPKKKAERLVQIIREQMKLHKEQRKQPKNDSDDPLKILKVRYARGEISKEEFEQVKKDLE